MNWIWERLWALLHWQHVRLDFYRLVEREKGGFRKIVTCDIRYWTRTWNQERDDLIVQKAVAELVANGWKRRGYETFCY